jgi:hypothetical protein
MSKKPRRAADEPLRVGRISVPYVHTRDGVEYTVPAFQLDASARPDVADLVRVVHSDGGGAAKVGWLGWQLHVDFVTPVRCSFVVQFDPSEHRAALELAARTGMLGLAVAPLDIRDGNLQTPRIRLHIGTVQLATVLEAER